MNIKVFPKKKLLNNIINVSLFISILTLIFSLLLIFKNRISFMVGSIWYELLISTHSILLLPLLGIMVISFTLFTSLSKLQLEIKFDDHLPILANDILRSFSLEYDNDLIVLEFESEPSMQNIDLFINEANRSERFQYCIEMLSKNGKIMKIRSIDKDE